MFENYVASETIKQSKNVNVSIMYIIKSYNWVILKIGADFHLMI